MAGLYIANELCSYIADPISMRDKLSTFVSDGDHNCEFNVFRKSFVKMSWTGTIFVLECLPIRGICIISNELVVCNFFGTAILSEFVSLENSICLFFEILVLGSGIFRLI